MKAKMGSERRLYGIRLARQAGNRRPKPHLAAYLVRMPAVAALAVAAAIFALLALVTWLVALYTRLEPAYGEFQALGIVAGVLAVIALVLISAAMIVGRARTSSRRH
jgi:hypothetical protein